MITQVQKMLEARRYTASDAEDWDKLIDHSVNGTFLFRRGFMEYHADRFEDFSYLLWRGKELVAVFVAGRVRNTLELQTLVAHPGLTYGGLVVATELKYPVLEEAYSVLLEAFQAEGFSKLIIKPVARVFCRQATEANIFYFHQNNFVLTRRELNSVIDLTQSLNISKGRKDNIRKARKSGLTIDCSNDFKSFWPLLIDNLWQTHGVQPPHSEKEIILLQQKYPKNIKLYVARLDETVVGGVVLFLDPLHGFAHTQYISANERGKQVGAVDAILGHILAEVHGNFLRFSFGISTAKGILNSGLLAQKEGFGATVELIDVYEKCLL
ncbi:GNAT family N-acetyltransferase [Hymenobacter sp. HMF4947]|uniref:GNAT family N-acetyltransferase n=1 Tax=Hymenobacter ginkgonis TaxID=2682976 RepID=A0A7K1TKS9_9BACT|nr:GNAT family N-acetyltransferase [Hymenobacter ginkgonis]MVN78983.1 GNAT family N-acetyltransferase [Hymenobacter ginkgonis]